MRLGNRVLVTGMTLLIGAVLLIGAGCGDDDADTPTTITGSLTNPEFVAVKAQLDNFVDSTVTFFKNGLNTVKGIAPGDIVIPQYAVSPEQEDDWDTLYTNGWHVINIDYTHKENDAAVWQTTLSDSIQYKANGVAQEDWTGRDQLDFRHHWTYDVAADEVSHTSYAGYAYFTFANLNTTTTTLTGGRDFTAHNLVVTADSTVVRDFTFTSDINNVALKMANDAWSNCPTSNTITATVEMVYTKDDADPVTTTWDATFSFNNGSMSASISKGNTVWSYTTDLCDSPQ
jgi:hypothetical protein